MSNFMSSVWDHATVRPLILPKQER
jgi:hypothetical protein